MSIVKQTKSAYLHAVGLEYDENCQDAPVISVKGNGMSADELVRIALRFGVPVIERKDVVRSLAELDEGQTIPEALFEAVALILNELEDASRGKAVMK